MARSKPSRRGGGRTAAVEREQLQPPTSSDDDVDRDPTLDTGDATTADLESVNLAEALDSATDRHSSIREASLQTLCDALQMRWLPEWMAAHRATLCETIDKSLRRGSDAEQIMAAHLAALAAAHLGEDFTDDYGKLRALLQTTLANPAVSYRVRAAVS